MVDAVAFNFIIDEIIQPNGEMRSDVPGGGGLQAAFGMSLWGRQPGLVSGIGADHYDACCRLLERLGIDTSGLQVGVYPTLRARQVYRRSPGPEEDLIREHQWLSPSDAIHAYLTHTWEHLPAAYREAEAFHLGIHPNAVDVDFLGALKASGGLVSLETFCPAHEPLPPQTFSHLLEGVNIFSLNRREATSLVGEGDDRALLARLAPRGAEVLVLRLGSGGALVVRGNGDEVWGVPALPVSVQDVTGAGNAFCGGFLAGWIATRGLLDAVLKGLVAASFAVEQYGLPEQELSVLRAEAERRYRRLRPAARRERLHP